MVYVVVTEIGTIELFTNDIMEAVSMVNFLKTEYDTNATILDTQEDIEDAMFNTDGINDAWFEDYYEWFPHDAGIDIKIPITILNQYFNKAIDAFAELEVDYLHLLNKYKEATGSNSYSYLIDKDSDDYVDLSLSKKIGCSDYILDKILHGEYMGV